MTKQRADMSNMRQVADDLGIQVNKVFGGYIRQPIDFEKQGQQYQVIGICAINSQKCSYVTNGLSCVCYSCQVYKKGVE